MSNPALETSNKLTELIERARDTWARARRAGQLDLANHADEIRSQLDAARGQLLTSTGPDSVATAAAFAAAGTIKLGGLIAQLDRVDLGIDRLAADRVDAADVIAWIEHNGIRLYPHQRRAIERRLPA